MRTFRHMEDGFEILDTIAKSRMIMIVPSPVIIESVSILTDEENQNAITVQVAYY